MKDYLDNIKRAREAIHNADAIVVGIGAGMSASGGLNYGDNKLVEKWYPEYYKLGLKTIGEIIGKYWVTTIKELSVEDAQKYWGFWARHTYHIRYEPSVTEPYQLLKAIIADKPHYIITTNGDHQTQKAFGEENVLATQGDYAYWQTVSGADDKLWYNEDMVKEMIENMPNQFEIRAEDIPYSKEYNERLMPNLRCDNYFVEKPWVENFDNYREFIADNAEKKMVFIEVGVGYNTPTIIRWPFERMANHYDNAKLIRMNLSQAEIPKELKNKGVSIEGDILEGLKYIKG